MGQSRATYVSMGLWLLAGLGLWKIADLAYSFYTYRELEVFRRTTRPIDEMQTDFARRYLRGAAYTVLESEYVLGALAKLDPTGLSSDPRLFVPTEPPMRHEWTVYRVSENMVMAKLVSIWSPVMHRESILNTGMWVDMQYRVTLTEYFGYKGLQWEAVHSFVATKVIEQ